MTIFILVLDFLDRIPKVNIYHLGLKQTISCHYVGTVKGQHEHSVTVMLVQGVLPMAACP